MTLPANDRISQVYITDGTTKRFDFTFRLFSQEDADGIMVRKKTLLGFDSVDKNLYSVVGNIGDEGGYVMFTTAPVAGQFLYIIGSTAVEQSLSITNYGNFNAHSLERVLDKIIAILQERQGDLTQEQQARVVADVYYDDLAKVREEDLKNYVDGIIGSITGQPFIGIADNFIQVKQPLTGSVARSQRDKNNETISVKDFKTTGSAWVTKGELLTAVQALNSRGGGTLEIPFGTVVQLEEGIDIPDHVTLKGCYRFPGSKANNSIVDYSDRQNLVVYPSGTISLGGSSGITGCIVARHGLVYGSATAASAFAGTAIMAGGDDVFMHENLVLGFERAFYSDGFQRASVGHNKIDCKNGIYLKNTYDISRVFQNHCWPFLTAFSSDKQALRRDGVAYHLEGNNDWMEMLDNFSYAYYRGTQVNGSGSTQIRVQHDNVLGTDGKPLFSDHLGIVIEGTSVRTQILKAHINSYATGIYINSNEELQDNGTHMINNAFITSGINGVIANKGHVRLGNCTFTDLTYGVVSMTASQRIISSSPNIFNASVETPYRCVGGTLSGFDVKGDIFFKPDGYSLSTNVLPFVVPIASAALNLPPNRNLIAVEVGGDLKQVHGCLPEREVTLIFAKQTTLIEDMSLTDYIYMPGTSGSKVFEIGEVAKLICIGTNWVLF